MPASIYSQVTDIILRQLETADPSSWICPWHRTAGGLPTNAATHLIYRGINILSLWCRARADGYASDHWATYRQWASLGAQVRRGETGTLVLFYRNVRGSSSDTPPHISDGGAIETTSEVPAAPARFIAKASTVFNLAQVDNTPLELSRRPSFSLGPIDPNPAFDAFVAQTGAAIEHGGERAAYIPSIDTIHMPPREAFHAAEGYTTTLAHELIHWTGARHRLDRDLAQRFGSHAYAAEELVAELGSAFILVELGLAGTPHPQHAAYMAGWLPLLRKDPRALFTAAARASSAAEYLRTTR